LAETQARSGVLVTGSSAGFGDVIVRTLAASGYRVYATMRGVGDRNAAQAGELREWAGREGLALTVHEMDVASEASVNAAVGSILASGEAIDVVVNNAGVAAAGPIEAFSEAQVQSIFDVNAFGPLRVNRAVLPHMRERGSGLLLHVSSTLGRILPGVGGLYPSTKWALEGLAESLSYQVKRFGVDTVILEPGSFPTTAVMRGMRPELRDIEAAYGIPAAPPRSAAEDVAVTPDVQEVADAVLRIIETPPPARRLRYVVGPVFTEGVEEFNEAYEAHKARLAEALRRPGQEMPWTRSKPD
jgi:NAD(P)-dependent dehydrogenase (short-subunit alcohol dehydrogenase family)